jgi:hypothetical protein
VNENTSSIATAVSPAEYRSARVNLFPSDNALHWFTRVNRRALVEGGALVMPTGRWQVVPAKFDAMVAQIGEQRARARAA